MEIEIKCHKCKLCFDMELEDDDGENEILIHCEICKKPNQVNYNIKNGKLITIKISNGKDLEDSQWVDPLIGIRKKRKEKLEEKNKIIIKQNGKWYFYSIFEIKNMMKPFFHYWDEYSPLNINDEQMRKHIKNELKYIFKKDEFLFSSYDGNNENLLQSKLHQRMDKLKKDYLKFYNFDGSLDLEVFSRDNPNQ